MLVPSIFRNDYVDDLFNDMFSIPTFDWEKSEKPVTASTDVQEFDDSYELSMELPGFNKEDIQAELKDGYMTITATHSDKKDEDEKDGKYIRRERYFGQYQRSFYVGDEITEEDIKAKFENGVLNLTVPKKEAKPQVEDKKYIAIEG